MKNIFKFILILVLIFLAIKPLFSSGFFPIHDDTQVSRVFEMGKSLKDGMFPVRWVEDLGYGYGYPIFNFYAPLPYYAGGFITLFGFDALLATKAIILIPVLLSFIFMFILGRELWGVWGGIIAATLYVYAPYHAVQIYVRGDFSEAWAYGFIPLVFYNLIKLAQKQEIKYIFLLAVSLTLLVISHNLTAFMSLFFLIPFGIFILQRSNKKQKLFKYLILSSVLAIFLSAFYIFPAILEIKYTNVFSQIGGGADFRDHFVCVRQIWESAWGFGGSAPGCIDGLSFKLGKLHLLLFVPLLFLYFKNKFDKKLIGMFFALFVLSLFLMLQGSEFIWETVPSMGFIQYPWRFLIFASFFSSLLAGATTKLTDFFPNAFRHKQSEYAFFVAIAAILLYAKLFVPQTILNKTSDSYTRTDILNFKISRVSDEFMPGNFNKPEKTSDIPTSALVVLGKGDVKLLDKKTNEVKAISNVSPNSAIHVNLAYFPSWDVYVNGAKAKVQPVTNGFNFNVPSGMSKINIRFSQTPIEAWSSILSLIGILILVTGTIQNKVYDKS